MNEMNRIQSILPLSPLQEGMLFHSLLEPDSEVYHEQITITLKGVPSINRLEDCFNQTIDQYEALRSIFIHEKVSKPRQVVLKNRLGHIQIEDIRRLEDKLKVKYLQNFKKHDRQNKFCLSRDLLIRLAVIIEEDHKFHLMFSFHHIIMDGWSVGIFLNTFFKKYQKEEPDNIDSFLPYTNKDYSDWLLQQDRTEALDYWKKALLGFEEPSFIFGIDSGSTSKTSVIDRNTFLISNDLSDSISDYVQRNSTTLNIFFQCIWGIMLQKYNNTDDVLFGSVVSGRNVNIQNIEHMVGLFINTLPVRFQMRTNETFDHLMKRMQLKAIEREQYGHIPLGEIQQQSELKQDLINHIFVFENYPMDQELDSLFYCQESQGMELRVEHVDVFEQTNYPFTIIIIPGKEIQIQFIYNQKCYDPYLIKKIQNHFIHMIHQVLENPEKPVAEFGLITEDERKIICDVFNDTSTVYPKDKTVHELFGEIVKKYQNKTALVRDGDSLTYKELDEMSNALARELQDQGVGLGKIVAVMMHKSIDFIVSILAILKAGGAYLPIDLRVPDQRIQDMLQDADVHVMLIHGQSKINLKSNIKLIQVNFLELPLRTTTLPNMNTSEDLIYVMYTSGSTGKPKGVMIPHRGVVRLVKNTNYIEFKRNDKILITSAVTFDVATFEIWGALLNGLQLLMIPDDHLLDPIRLEEFINKNGVSILWLTSALFSQLAAQNLEIFKNLRVVMVGGDVVSVNHANEIIRQYPNVCFIDGYGPTENTTFSTTYHLKECTEGSIPIGKPIANSTAYIFDKNAHLLPIGVTGELWVGGDGLAKGYLNRPELTQERFVNDPLGKGEILYRTGDLAAWMPDGNIRFLGRMDNQVKIRGFRIELSEIEWYLKQLKHIKNCSVQVRTTPNNEKYMCAYLVGDKKINIEQIKAALFEKLPSYSVPEHFILMDHLPLNINGKINKHLLPDPLTSLHKNKENLPSSNKEKQIAAVWQRVLCVETLSIDDDFFDLGGNSLNAIQVFGQLNQMFMISMQQLFECRTIRRLANVIEFKEHALKERIEDVIQGYKQISPIDIDTHLEGKRRKYQAWIKEIAQISYTMPIDQTDPIHILLTGATGFLGMHLLQEILCCSNARITLLIRAETVEKAKKRVLSQYEFYFKCQMPPKWLTRIEIQTGNMSTTNLGLSQINYDKCCDEIDCIINTAANVKHFGAYDTFHEVNVKGVENLIHFAQTGTPKIIYHISTLSVGFLKVADHPYLFTEQIKDLSNQVANPYLRSKVEGEALMIRAIQNGLKGKIFRVGNLVGHSETGQFQVNINDNAFYQMLRAFLELGIIPELYYPIFDFSFIDSVGKAILTLIMKNNMISDIYHIIHPKLVHCVELAEMLAKNGYDLQVLPMEKFGQVLLEKHEQGLETSVQKLLLYGYFLNQPDIVHFHQESTLTNTLLNSTGFNWPTLNRERFQNIIDYCKNVSFF